MEKKKIVKTVLSNILLILLFLGFPAVIGGALTLFSGGNLVFLECSFVIFGLFELLVWVTRGRRRDSKNIKKNHTIYEEKDTDEYKAYKRSQWRLLACGIITTLASLVVFLFER